MKAVFLTAGAAGMYCGSCMHDNALARALRDAGVDCVLQPVYTPIRTDSQSVATDQVFLGGIHIYLLQQMPWLRRVPAPLLRPLNWPPLIRWATQRAGTTDAAKLAELSLSMLRGVHGRQAVEVKRLIDWFADEMKPDAIVLSNLLIGGALPQIRDRLPHAKIVVLLQGDDIFLDHLPEPSRAEAIKLCADLIRHVDCVIVHSQFYADKMAALLSIPREKLVITPLSIDLSPFEAATVSVDTPSSDPPSSDLPANTENCFRLGYLARIAPEKGLHHLVDAFITLATQPQHRDLTLHVAGWLGQQNREYFQAQIQKIADAGLSDRFTHHGSPDLDGKTAFLKSLDLLSVPADYEDPKGLFILEALAAGVPVVQPHHGAFIELIESTGGGVTFAPGNVESLADVIHHLKHDSARLTSLGKTGQANVRAKHSIDQAAIQMRQLLFGS
ncbi:MAG: glycosyltransferase family 4 protein [Pirellulaceae bacterium]|nr:glycosyltransferase family 4 protein [Pirellulaceae bacterium]